MIETYGNPIGGGTNIKTLPMQISNLAATAGTDGIAGYIDVSFNEPPATSWGLVKNYIIVYKEGSIPTSPFDGYRVIAGKVAASGKIEKRISSLTFDLLYGIRIFPFSVDNKYQTSVTGSTATATPVAGIRLGDLMAGTEVDRIKGIENDPEVQFLVLKHNYENGGGTLISRDTCYKYGAYDIAGYSVYSISDINKEFNAAYLNNNLKETVKSKILTSEIPWTTGSDNLGRLSTKIFALSLAELGFKGFRSLEEGHHIPYFNSRNRRIKTFNNSATNWWTRTKIVGNSTEAYYIDSSGNDLSNRVDRQKAGFLPSFCLPPSTLVKPEPDSDGCYIPI